jgi:hypothetical protein
MNHPKKEATIEDVIKADSLLPFLSNGQKTQRHRQIGTFPLQKLLYNGQVKLHRVILYQNRCILTHPEVNTVSNHIGKPPFRCRPTHIPGVFGTKADKTMSSPSRHWRLWIHTDGIRPTFGNDTRIPYTPSLIKDQ